MMSFPFISARCFTRATVPRVKASNACECASERDKKEGNYSLCFQCSASLVPSAPSASDIYTQASRNVVYTCAGRSNHFSRRSTLRFFPLLSLLFIFTLIRLRQLEIRPLSSKNRPSGDVSTRRESCKKYGGARGWRDDVSVESRRRRLLRRTEIGRLFMASLAYFFFALLFWRYSSFSTLTPPAFWKLIRSSDKPASSEGVVPRKNEKKDKINEEDT